ncbi:hypothetical protein [Streptomyces sp. NBC_01205]|uniref:hypothetical protein n=1 Tax=Streptomyces sp. NBC_01205 TaxID=2903771 RepID=UPI002E126519|nr:hypothetical protein OG573_43200 [Streptomyces sp. NBC_01205]
MAFRRSISQDELREKQTPEQREQHATDYQASRGGWFSKKDQDETPAPGAGNGTGGRLRRWTR